MATLRWPRRSTWRDETHAVGGTDPSKPFVAGHGDTVDIDDGDLVEHYLERGWVAVDDDEEDGDADGDQDERDIDHADTDPDTEVEELPDEDDEEGDVVDKILTGNVGPASELIADVDDEDVLEEVEEQDGRKGVQDAIAKRRDELNGD